MEASLNDKDLIYFSKVLLYDEQCQPRGGC